MHGNSINGNAIDRTRIFQLGRSNGLHNRHAVNDARKHGARLVEVRAGRQRDEELAADAGGRRGARVGKGNDTRACKSERGVRLVGQTTRKRGA